MIASLTVRPQARTTFDEQALVELAQSIREQGILHPLLAHKEGDRIVVDDGERRFRAAKVVGLTTVPVIVTDRPLTAAERLQVQLVSACQRQGLSVLDEARAIKHLID